MLVFVPRLSAQQEPESASDTEQESSISISGVIEAVVSHELSAESEQIASWKLKRILPHGATVKKGQTVVWFDTEAAEKQLKAAEIEVQLAKLALDDEEFKYRQFLETQKLDRGAAARAIKKARQDYDHFTQVEKPRLIRTSEFNLESAMASVENAREELSQLEQMYRDDDMTEESEKIVLKRAQRSVDSAEYRLEGTKIQSDLMKSRGVTEQSHEKADELARAELTYKQTVRDLDSAKKRRDIEIAKSRDAFTEKQSELEELREERRQSTLTSPIDGIVFHGKLSRGKLPDKASSLKPSSSVTSEQVIATVVDPDKVQIRVDLSEKHLQHVQKGSPCNVSVTAIPDFSGTAAVRSIGNVPFASTKYDCVVGLKKSKELGKLIPTMTCKLDFAVAP